MYYYNVAMECLYRGILQLCYPQTLQIIRRIRQGNARYAGSFKYVHLHQLLSAFRPKTILEFGTGSSTGVFGLYAAKTGALVWSVEDSQQWLDNTRKALQGIAPGVEFIFSNSVTEKDVPNKCYFDYKPDRSFDLVYVAGPPLLIEGKSDSSAVNWNIVEMIRRGLEPRFIIVDGRVATARYISSNFGESYAAYLRHEACFPGFRYHSYFVRR